MEEETRQGGRGRFASSPDEDGAVCHDLNVRHALLAVSVLSEHVGHEVSPPALQVGTHAHARLGFGGGILTVLLLLAEGASGLEVVQHLEDGVRIQEASIAGGLDVLEYGLDPRVVVAGLEAVERVGKREVPDDVERRKVEPVHNVHRITGLGELREPLHQEIYVFLDDGLLLVHGGLAERVGQVSTLPAVDLGRVASNDGDVVAGKEEVGNLPKLGPAATAMMVDFGPCHGALHSYQVWSDAHNRAIFVVHVDCLANPRGLDVMLVSKRQ